LQKLKALKFKVFGHVNSRQEVWGSPERHHTYREEIYKRNDYNVIFVHAYKHQKDWKRFLVKRIMAIEEQRHDEVMKMLQTLQF